MVEYTLDVLVLIGDCAIGSSVDSFLSRFTVWTFFNLVSFALFGVLVVIRVVHCWVFSVEPSSRNRSFVVVVDFGA